MKKRNIQPQTSPADDGDLRPSSGGSKFAVDRSSFARREGRQGGVALIVTVIMLSVITFLAVAFLALMGREKGSVKIATDQTIARLASDTARDRAQAELLATILANTNLASFDLLVSTNFVNWNGFDPAAVNRLANVNYDHQLNNTPLTAAQSLQNLANLFYNPRPPVFVTNRLAGTSEFPYYNDLNRNGRADRTGYWPMTNHLGQAIFTNSTLVTNYLVGDPEWIGGLERADLSHSPSNRFAYRYSYLVVPAGKTLDVNYIHNETQAGRGAMNQDGTQFLRNEGVGTWELNLAAFLHDLNTNAVYGWGNLAGTHSGYDYASIDPLGLNPLNPVLPPIRGNAFKDAAALYRYRLNGDPKILTYNLAPISGPRGLYGNRGDFAFRYDYVDGYSAGPLLTTPFAGLRFDPDDSRDRPPFFPWPGAPQTNHFFTPQDLYNPAKTDPAGGGYKFSERLTMAGTNISTYDEYTYYRLLSQLGTDSAPEGPEKLNLNYVNVGGLSATNFIPWTDNAAIQAYFNPLVVPPGSVLFFSNVVDRLLKVYTSEWLATDRDYFTNQFQVTNAFRLTAESNYTYVPVFVNGRMVYSPAVHRILQLAANIWDAKTNRHDRFGALPTVFQPRFSKINGNIFITSFVEIQRTNELAGLPLLDLTVSTNVPASFADNSLIYGVPLVVGAQKGLPNFNEYAMESMFTITRKIELVKSSPGGQDKIVQTNQFFTLNVSMASGVEFWNSYRSNYTRPVTILVTNLVTISLTNDNSVVVSNTFRLTGVRNTNRWAGWKDGTRDGSFIVPVKTNVALFLPPTKAYLPGTGKFLDPVNAVYEVDPRLLFPRWKLAVTNRVQAMVVDDATGRIIDYVLLGDMTANLDLAAAIGQDPTRVDPINPFKGLWGTNAIGAFLSGRPGIYQQILASRGNFGNISSSEWTDQGSFTGNRPAEIARFKAFFTPNHEGNYTDPETHQTFSATNGSLRAYAPFTPSITLTVPLSWQANDPLVHYIARDMLYVEAADLQRRITPPGSTNYIVLENIGSKNKRYQPWPTDSTSTAPDAFNVALKDPLMTSSDEWQFPSNALPNIGWLGRVHRGTPWQTVYLKSSDLGIPLNEGVPGNSTSWVSTAFAPYATKWSKWTGDRDLREGFLTRPVTDRVLFDEFTTTFDENSSRGQLPINQSGLAAWSAVLSGVVTLTNTSPTLPRFAPVVVQPAGVYDPLNGNTLPPLVKIVEGINRTRANTNLFPGGAFQHLGDILAVPELSVGEPVFVPKPSDPTKNKGDWYWTNKSPYLELGGPVAGTKTPAPAPTTQQKATLNDAAVEWLPQQILSLLQLGEPRFVIYAYGQALHPAANSVLTSGPYFQMCTNYQITAEVATRAVVRVEGSPDPRNLNHPDAKKRYPPHLVVESFNYLPPD